MGRRFAYPLRHCLTKRLTSIVCLPLQTVRLLILTSRQIGLRLGTAFGLLVAILIGIGYLGLSRMNQINANLNDVIGRQWTTLHLSRQALAYSSRNSRITMEIFLLKDKRVIDPLLKSRAENTQTVSELITKIQSQCDSAEDKRLLAAVKDARALYVASYLGALHLLIDEHQYEAASALMVEETTPALFKYHSAWDNFVQFQMDQVDRAAKESRARYATARALVLLLIVFAVLIATSIALFATRKMAQEMSTRILAEREVRELNAGLERRVEERTQELRLIFESTAGAIYGIDLEGRCTFCNPACLRLLGYAHPDELLGKNMHDLIHHSRRDGTKLPVEECRIFQAFKSGQGVHVDDEVLWKSDGTSFPAEYWSYPQRKAEHIVGAAVAFIDITERRVAEERIRHLAYYDALTGLPNRLLFQDRLAKALASARRRREKVALLFMDLDRFKTINDSLGHSIGDCLLNECAERLKNWAREQDTVARLGGDEFVVVLTALKDVTDAAVAASRIMQAMSVKFVIQGHLLSVTCSLGISVFPDHGTDGEALLKNADAAMYCGKENGRNNFQFFTQDMNVRAVERLTLENDLRLALEKKELFLMYQPQRGVATAKVTGAEALLRWQHPRLGLVPPDKLIPIAENSGLIIPIGEWVLRTACAQVRQWQDQGLPALPVAVNVSAVQFRQKNFPELIGRVLHETGLPPQYLELELTESMLLSNADVTLSVLQELKEMGVKLSIDDFGTGYSSLSYLKHLPVYKLKIDRSFVRDITVDPDDAAITGAIINMAKSLDLKVIAEGVENEGQMSFLRQHNCDEIQGYYFSRPLGAADFAEKLRSSPSLQPDLRSDVPSHGWSEQRRYPRYRTNLMFRVLNYKERDLDGSCLVIAEGGLGGILPEPIPVGSVVQLQLALPSHLTAPLPWAVVRYRVDAHHGFEFVSLTEAEKLSIRQFCSKLAILTTKTIAPGSGIPGAGAG